MSDNGNDNFDRRLKARKDWEFHMEGQMPEVKKEPKECGNLANMRYTWPGKNEVVVCIECAMTARNVANAIGLWLELIPVTSHDVPDPLEWPTCTVMRTKDGKEDSSTE